MSKSNNSSDDFKLDSSNPYEKFKGLKYSKDIYEYCMNKDYFKKDTLYNFLMSSPDFTPSMLKLNKEELARHAALNRPLEKARRPDYCHYLGGNRYQPFRRRAVPVSDPARQRL